MSASSLARTLGLVLAASLTGCGPAIIGAAAGGGGGGGGGGGSPHTDPAELASVAFTEDAGPTTNVIDLPSFTVGTETRVAHVVDAKNLVFRFRLRVKSIADNDVFGLGFNVEFTDVDQSEPVGLQLVSFVPNKDLLAAAAPRDSDPKTVVVGVAARGGNTVRLPVSFEIGEFTMKAKGFGDVSIKFVPTTQPDLSKTTPGIAYIAKGAILEVVTGPATRGGRMSLIEKQPD